MNLKKAKYAENETKNSGSKIIRWFLLFVFLVFIAIELVGAFIASGSVYFVETKKDGEGIKIFNSSILNKYYSRLSTQPYNYSNSFAAEKPKDCFRVFLAGEASLAGWPYSCEQSIKNKVDQLFDSISTNENIEVITVCSAGFNTAQAVDLIPQLFEFKPDLIILYAGHNEFYGYNGFSELPASSIFHTVNLVDSALEKVGIYNSLCYDNKADDLEVLLPFNSAEQNIARSQNEYFKIKNQFLSNIDKIISMCSENKTQLVLSVLSDNYLLPPVGVQNKKDEISADIIYNNARMALLRDGDESSAISLFRKSKDADAFRLRIPEDFMDDLKKIAAQNKISIADIRSEFGGISPNNIPGENLFADYIHPNAEGLNIIASVYARIIHEKYLTKTGGKTDMWFDRNMSAVSPNDSVLAKTRISNSLYLIKSRTNIQNNFNLSLK